MPDVNILINATNKASGPIKQVGSDIDGLSGKADKASKGGIGSLLGALGTGLVVGAAAGVAALGALGAAVAITGTNFNNMKQQATIAFTTMLGDGGKAKVFLDDLQKFAASTPFEFPELLQASQRLLAMGFAAEDVKPTLTAVGDAVAALGGSSEMVGRVTTALGQMQAKGKASSEEMMQMTEAGIPAWQMLADAIGVDVSDAMKMVTLGAVSSDTAITALVDGMNTKFGGLMAKQSQTFGGLFSTIKDTFQQVSGQVMQPFFDLMTRGLKMIVDWTSSPAFTDGIAQLTRWIDMAANAAGAFFADLLSGQSVVDSLTHALRILLPPSLFLAWESFVDTANSVFGAINDLYTSVVKLVTPVVDLISQFVSWQDVLVAVGSMLAFTFGPAIAATIGAFVATFAPIIATFAALTAASVLLRAAWTGDWQGILDTATTLLPMFVTKLKEWANAAWQWIVDATPLVIGKLKEWGKAVIGWLGDRLPDLIVTVYKWGTALVTWISDVIPKAIDALSAFVRGLRDTGEGEGGSQFGQMAQGWAGKLWRWIRDDLIPAVGPAFSDFIRSMLTYGGKLLASLGTLAKELGLTLWDWIVTITPVAVKKLGEWGSALWDWVDDHKDGWGASLAGWAEAAWIWIRDVAIPEAVKKIGEWGGLLLQWIDDNKDDWGTALAGWAEAAWIWIRDVAIPEASKKLIEWGGMLIQWVDDNKQDWFDKLKVAGEGLIDWLGDGMEIAWINLTKWFFSDTAFGGLVGDILEMLGVQLGPAYGVLNRNGQEIVYSLNNGSRYGLPALRQTGSDMGSAISGGLEANLDMHSPSRVMWGYGQDIMAGLQGGISAGMTGLKTEMQFVADQIKVSMALANSEMLASVEYFTNQMAVKVAAVHYKIRQSVQDISKLVQQHGLNPATLPASMGGTGQVVGFGPNGELIMGGITNLPHVASPAAPLAAAIPASTIGSAVGGGLSTTGATQSLLGGISLGTADIQGAMDSAASATVKVQDFIAGISDFLSATVDNRTVSKVFQSLDSNLTGLVDLRDADSSIRKAMATILGVETLYGRLTDSVKMVADKITEGTDINHIKSLLQSAVDFRQLANFYSTADYADVLPTDARLTGAATTNNFNISLQGSPDAAADLISTFNLLYSLYGTAPA